MLTIGTTWTQVFTHDGCSHGPFISFSYLEKHILELHISFSKRLQEEIHVYIWRGCFLTGNCYTFSIWQILSLSSHSTQPLPSPCSNGALGLGKMQTTTKHFSGKIISFHILNVFYTGPNLHRTPLCACGTYDDTCIIWQFAASCVATWKRASMVTKTDIYKCQKKKPIYTVDSLRFTGAEFHQE